MIHGGFVVSHPETELLRCDRHSSFWKMAHVVRWCIYEVARVPRTEDYDFKLHHPGIWSELCTGQMSCPVFGLVHNIHLYIFLMTAGGRMCKWDFIANIPPPFEGAQMHYMFLATRSGERAVVRLACGGGVGQALPGRQLHRFSG